MTFLGTLGSAVETLRNHQPPQLKPVDPIHPDVTPKEVPKADARPDVDHNAKPFELPFNPHFPDLVPPGRMGDKELDKAEKPSVPSYTADDLYGPNGPQPEDINQDSIGDCYFVATLSGMAGNADGDQQIQDSISYDEQSGNFTVTFYEEGPDGKPQERQVTVTQEDVRDNIARRGGSQADNGGGPIWPAVMEAAYAKMHLENATANGTQADPRIDGGYGPGSADRLDANGKPIQARDENGDPKVDAAGNPVYEQVEVGGISGGFATDAYYTLTGKESSTFQAPSGDGLFGPIATALTGMRLQTALANGQTVTVAIAPERPGESKDGLIGGHQYTVQRVYQDEETGEWMVELRNPWDNNGSDSNGHGAEGIGDGSAVITVPLDTIHTHGYQGFVVGDK